MKTMRALISFRSHGIITSPAKPSQAIAKPLKNSKPLSLFSLSLLRLGEINLLVLKCCEFRIFFTIIPSPVQARHWDRQQILSPSLLSTHRHALIRLRAAFSLLQWRLQVVEIWFAVQFRLPHSETSCQVRAGGQFSAASWRFGLLYLCICYQCSYISNCIQREVRI